MYRLLVYGLAGLMLIAFVFSFFGWVSFSPWSLLGSQLILVSVCLITNILFAKLFRAATNVESVYITAFILFFVISPFEDLTGVYVLAISAAVSMASKYILAIGKKHLFNPAGVAALALTLSGSGLAIWWIATPAMAIPVAVFGFLILRKTRRFELFMSFFVVVIVASMIQWNPAFGSRFEVLKVILLSGPLLFFGTVMLTEPLTTPYKKYLQITYGAIVGLLWSTQFHLGPIYSTPEFALIVGNLFSYFVSPKQKLKLYFESMKEIAPQVFDLTFRTEKKLRFVAGQYLEWTLPHEKPDLRGNRRYFTIASSPTEENIHLGVRIDPKNGSSFKKKLISLHKDETLMVGQLAGEFILPKDTEKKLIFVAGGIGITPFVSMFKYLADKGEKRDIVLFYTCLTDNDFAYRAEIDAAKEKIGLKTVYIATNVSGFITKEMITSNAADFIISDVYISGANAMVKNYKKLLKSMGIAGGRIHTDYFPGY